jgi:4-alpha-glucanotransferase
VTERHAGILLPLFSLRSRRDWGVGDLGDLPDFCRWLATAGHRVLQLLPIAEMAAHETSPYGALTAFALDPLYIALDAVEEFTAAGGVAALSAGARADLEAARAAPGLAYARIRHAKGEGLAAAFAHFEREESRGRAARTAAFASFVEAESWWLED